MQKWTKQQCDEYDEARNIFLECELLRERMRVIEKMNYTSNKTVKKAHNLAIKTMEERLIELTNQLKCTCQISEDDNGTCHACLNQWSNERYGYLKADY